MTENDGQPTSRWQRFRAQLRHTYRLVVMNNETFEEVRSLQLTLLNVYVVLSSVVVVVALLVVGLIAFTPVKKYIPGYGDTVERQQLTRLYRQVRDLEREMEAHRAYSDNFRRILVGEVETAAQAEAKAPILSDTTAHQPAELSTEEAQLRREVDLDQVGQAARQPGSAANVAPQAGSRDVPLEQLFFVAPVRGEISARFNASTGHYGIDILGPKNTAIKAALDGYVFLSDWTLETGNTIGIQHANNVITFYKHNAELLKKAGSFVKAGEAVAIIGNTGTLSSGPHLHFELWHKGLPVDPSEYIKL